MQNSAGHAPGRPELNAIRTAFDWAANLFSQGGEFFIRGRKFELLRMPSHLVLPTNPSTREYVEAIVINRAKPWAEDADEWALGFRRSGSDTSVAGVRIIQRQFIIQGFCLNLADAGSDRLLAHFLHGATALVITDPNQRKRTEVAGLRGLIGNGSLPQRLIEIRPDKIEMHHYLAGSWWTAIAATAWKKTPVHEALYAALQLRSIRQETLQEQNLSSVGIQAARRELSNDPEVEISKRCDLDHGSVKPASPAMTPARSGASTAVLRRPSGQPLESSPQKPGLPEHESHKPATEPQKAFVKRLVQEFPDLKDHLPCELLTSRKSTSRWLGRIAPHLERLRALAGDDSKTDALSEEINALFEQPRK